MEENLKIQNQMWLREQQMTCRKKALDIALSFKILEAKQMIEEASLIYEWLMNGYV